MGRSFHTVVFHKFPHLDEVVAYILALLYGRRIWPGINKAKVMFWDAGAKTPDGRPAHEWQSEGYLLIGVGRWGSTGPWLGIPVTWDEISGSLPATYVNDIEPDI